MSPAVITARNLLASDLEILVRSFPQPTPVSHAKRLQRQQDGDYTYSCLEIDDTVVAIQLTRWHGPNSAADAQLSTFPQLGSLYVLPEHRGKGYASMLLQHSEQAIRSKGFAAVGAIIKDNNLPSIAMHTARGYVAIGEASRSSHSIDIPRTYYLKQLRQTDH